MPTVDSQELLAKMDAGFDISEAHDVAFKLGIDWGNLRGETKHEKLIALLDHCARQELRGRLIEILVELRPQTFVQGLEWIDPIPICPYPGMVPFQAKDRRFFHGREDEIEDMLQRLRLQRTLFVF